MKKARLWIALVIAAALAVSWRVLPVGAWLEGFQRWIAGLGFIGAVLYGLIYVVAAVLFVPGAALTIGAGLLFGPVRGTLIVWFASTTAAAIAFLIARYVAREQVERWARDHPRFGALDRAIRRRGWRVVALLRLNPLVPFNLSNYLYGLTPVAFWPYVLASGLAMLPATVVYVSIGAAGQAATSAGRQHGHFYWMLLGVGLVATVVLTVMMSRAARRELDDE